MQIVIALFIHPFITCHPISCHRTLREQSECLSPFTEEGDRRVTETSRIYVKPLASANQAIMTYQNSALIEQKFCN